MLFVFVNHFSTAGIDYEANSASFIFTNGQKTGDNQCFSVAIYHNVIVEDTEFFSANLTSLDPDVIISQGHGSSIITIYDDPDDSELIYYSNVRKEQLSLTLYTIYLIRKYKYVVINPCSSYLYNKALFDH